VPRPGVVIVDCNFGIMFADHVAQELLGQGDGVRRGRGGIAAGTPPETLALRRHVAGACIGGHCTLIRRARGERRFTR
jgi:hypothetical protein